MRIFYVLTTFLLFSRLVLAQTRQPSSSDAHTATALQDYDDPVNGLTFRYPVSWLLNQGGGAYIPPVALENNGNPAEPYKPEGYVNLQGRDASQGPYRDTNFINGWFLYRVVSGVEEEQCYRNADSADEHSWPKDEWKADWVTIGGVRFRHGSGRAAGLCNYTSQDVYATLHLHKCYLFEKQINTTCEHGENALRDITPKELREINKAFDAVMQSVRLKNSGSAGSSH